MHEATAQLHRYIELRRDELDEWQVNLLENAWKLLRNIERLHQKIRAAAAVAAKDPLNRETGELSAFGFDLGLFLNPADPTIGFSQASSTHSTIWGTDPPASDEVAAAMHEVEGLTIQAYQEMHRVYSIFKKLPELKKFKPAGVFMTRNHLIEHPEQAKSPRTAWSFGIRSEGGPTVKPAVINDQTGYESRGYYPDSDEFWADLSRVLEEVLEGLV